MLTSVRHRAPTGSSPLLQAVAKSALLAMIGGLAVLGAWQASVIGPVTYVVVLAALALAIAVGVGWPILDAREADQPMAPLIALVGCDGSGKTTLSADLLARLSHERSVASCYLGLGSGTMGERLKRLPLIGVLLERKLAKKAKQTRTKGEKIPGLLTAVVVYAFSLARLRRFRRVLTMRRTGITVITDRYPQTEVLGFYDGPGLSAARANNGLVAALARHERRMYDWMATFRPNLVIRLNVDAETAFARKPDHKYELLCQKVAATGRLRFSGAPIVEVDSRRPYPDVCAEAEGVVRQTLSERIDAAPISNDEKFISQRDRLRSC